MAVSTGLNEKSALGIVRVSGFQNLDFLKSLTNRKGSIEPRKAYFTRFFDSEGQVLDEGIFLYFKGPHSFTGENVIEFNLHGNPLLLERFVDHLVGAYGFKRAKPGEFSYRAMCNNKLNLTQIEGLDLLLNANSGFGLKAGTELLHNELFKEYGKLKALFLEMKASLELLIDFAEDVGEDEIISKLNRDMKSFKVAIGKLKSRTQGRLNDVLAPSVGLFGQTNAGKSTFFNKLYGDRRAIVSNVHGTTRDYISETIQIEGQPFKLVDTAGLRETTESVESAGINRSLELLESTFFKVLLINPFDEFSLDLPRGIDCIVLTHADVDGFIEASKPFLKDTKINVFASGGSIGAENFGPIGPNSKSGPTGAKQDSGSIGPVSKNGPIGAAISLDGPIGPGVSLETAILMRYQELISNNPIPIERHRHEISNIYDSFYELLSTYESSQDLAILSSVFNRLGSSLDQLIGVVSPQEVLDHIFENFCIGK